MNHSQSWVVYGIVLPTLSIIIRTIYNYRLLLLTIINHRFTIYQPISDGLSLVPQHCHFRVPPHETNLSGSAFKLSSALSQVSYRFGYSTYIHLPDTGLKTCSDYFHHDFHQIQPVSFFGLVSCLKSHDFGHDGHEALGQYDIAHILTETLGALSNPACRKVLD